MIGWILSALLISFYKHVKYNVNAAVFKYAKNLRMVCYTKL